MEYEKDANKRKVTQKLKDTYSLAIQYYNKGNIEEAKQHLVQAIRPVLSKPLMKSIYVDLEDVLDQTLDAMYHLGLIYQQHKESSDNYSKAAAIFQYCYGFAFKYQDRFDSDVEPEQYLKAAFLAEGLFLESIGKDTNPIDDEYYQQVVKNTKNYKSELTDFRDITKGKLASIADWKLDRIAERAQIIEDIYTDSVKFFIDHDSNSQTSGLIQRLIKDSIKQLGEPPEGCEYSIIGLGSLALGTMTPWSDLEFAILIGEDKPVYKEYFRNLTKLLHIKIINFGETPLRTVGIETLNNFKTADASDEWFWDDVLESGFSFDGPDWHACKTPSGRQGYKVLIKSQDENGIEVEHIIEKPDYELILTPEQMIKFQSEDPATSQKAIQSKESKLEEPETPIDQSWFKSDKHLVQALRSVCLIEGSQRLLNQYRDIRQNSIPEEISKKRSLEILKEDVDKFQIKLGDEEEGKLLDVKKDIYRLGDRVVTALTDYYDIICQTDSPSISIWQKIDTMQEKEHLSKEGEQHLKEALSIAAELRMNTYANNASQGEGMSTYIPAVEHLPEEQRKKLVEKTFHIKDTALLHHFYYVMIAVQETIKYFCSEEHHDVGESFIKRSNLFVDSNHCKGMVHARFLEYNKALNCLEKAKTENSNDLAILDSLVLLYSKIGSSKLMEKSAKLELSISDNRKDIDKAKIAIYHNHLGSAYVNNYKLEKAAAEYEKSIKLSQEYYGPNSNHLSIIESLINIGTIFNKLGNFDEAEQYYFKALKKIDKKISNFKSNKCLATIYTNLSGNCIQKSDFDNANEYNEESLKIMDEIYKNNSNHPDIIHQYTNLADIYFQFGQYTESIKMYENSLMMCKKFFGSIYQNMPQTISIFICIAEIYARQSNFQKSEEYYQKCLNEIKNKPQNHEFMSIYRKFGDYNSILDSHNEAIKYYNMSLTIHEQIFRENTVHPKIADIYNNMGCSYLKQENYSEAFKYLDKSLKMREVIFKDNINHHKVAQNYRDIGLLYENICEYKKSENYYEKAIKIYKKVHVKNPDHIDIARTYLNYAGLCQKQDKFKKAEKLCREALEIYKICYEDSNHLEIASLHVNLGLLLQSQSDYENSIKELTLALEIFKIIYKDNPNHKTIGNAYLNLGGAYLKNKDLDLGIEVTLRAAEIFLTLFPDQNHSVFEKIFNNLGCLYRNKEDLTNALVYHKKALEIRKKDLNNEEIMQSKVNIGLVYCDQKKYKEAIEKYEEVLEFRVKFWEDNPNHPDLGSIYSKLGEANIMYGKSLKDKELIEKGLNLCEKALEIMKIIFANNLNHPDIDFINKNIKLGNAEIAVMNGDSSNQIKIQSIILEQFKKQKPKCQESDNDLEIEIKTSDIYHEHIKAFCRQQLELELDDVTCFEKGSCWITLSPKSKEILRDIVSQEAEEIAGIESIEIIPPDDCSFINHSEDISISGDTSSAILE